MRQFLEDKLRWIVSLGLLMRMSVVHSFIFGMFLFSHQAQANERCAIATAHPKATAAGCEVLLNGGNAFDAAIAVTAALGGTSPRTVPGVIATEITYPRWGNAIYVFSLPDE